VEFYNCGLFSRIIIAQIVHGQNLTNLTKMEGGKQISSSEDGTGKKIPNLTDVAQADSMIYQYNPQIFI